MFSLPFAFRSRCSHVAPPAGFGGRVEIRPGRPLTRRLGRSELRFGCNSAACFAGLSAGAVVARGACRQCRSSAPPSQSRNPCCGRRHIPQCGYGGVGLDQLEFARRVEMQAEEGQAFRHALDESPDRPARPASTRRGPRWSAGRRRRGKPARGPRSTPGPECLFGDAVRDCRSARRRRWSGEQDRQPVLKAEPDDRCRRIPAPGRRPYGRRDG